MKALGATYWGIEYSLEFKTLIFARKWDFGILRDYSSQATTTMVMNSAPVASFDGKVDAFSAPRKFSVTHSYVFDRKFQSRLRPDMGHGSFVKTKVKTAASRNIQKPTQNAGQRYLRDAAANRGPQNQHLTRTNDKITLCRRESGKPFFYYPWP